MPKEAPEGIVFRSNDAGEIDYNDKLGNKEENNEVLGLSKSQIETVDVLTEGPMGGLVTGRWFFSGNLGDIGWASGVFSGYKYPSTLTDAEFLRSIYWNEVPVLNDNSQLNFQSIDVKHTVGLPNGEVLQTLSPFQTVSRTIGERLRAGSTNAKIYRILNKDCRGVVVNIKISSLANTDTSTGNIERTRVDYFIQYRPIFFHKEAPDYIEGKNETVWGKVTSGGGYIRTSRIDFSSNFLDDDDFIGWEIKIERVTEESTSAYLSNQTSVESITEIQGNVYTFPNSATVRSLFDAEYFQSIPERAYEAELLKVKIPGNYNPIFKTYSGVGFATTNGGWNGEFATGRYWTDNPAWCYYDLLTNKRYGLGKYIDENLVDKTSLYEIGKYCDTLVADGYGGLEPRFTCNMWFTTREDAYKIINDMASVFRGLTYYANGSIFAIQDSPKTPIITFTNANVEDGNFNYSTASKKQRNSVAIIRYNDPKDFYKPAIEYVEDFDAIRKFGIREIELTAFGCTSRGQAIRLGRWVLLSDNLEPESIKFTAAIGEASYIKPGDVFRVHDSFRKSKRYGGRVAELKDIGGTGSDIVLDYKIDTESNVGYKIAILTPSFNYNPSQVSGLNSLDYSGIRRSFVQEFGFSGYQCTTSGSKTVLNLYYGLDYTNYVVTGNQIWTIELQNQWKNYSGNQYFSNETEDYYRTINIVEKDINKYEIEGLQYNPNKYPEIESGLLFSRNISNLTRIPASPYNLDLNVSIAETTTNKKNINYSFLIDDITNVDTFKVYAKLNDFDSNGVPDAQYLINNLPNYRTNGVYGVKNAGTYYFRVYASNDSQGILSPSYATGAAIIYTYEAIRNVNISSLRVENTPDEFESPVIVYSGSPSNYYTTTLSTVDTDNPTFTWQVGFDDSILTIDTIYFRATVRQIGDYYSRVPTDSIIYETTGLTSPTFTFALDDNIASSGGPYRNYQVAVEAHDADGNTSAGHTLGVLPDNSWSNYPNNYDILSVVNPRPSGAEFSDNITSEDWGLVNETVGDTEDYSLITESVDATGEYGLITDTLTYIANGYIGPNGDIVINQFFNLDYAGGYLYVSTGQFDVVQSGLIIAVENGSVKKSIFYYDTSTPYIYHPNAAFNLKNSLSGFISVSFFDSMDAALIAKNVDVSTGLYVSQNNVFFSDSSIGRITLGGTQTIKLFNHLD